MSYTITATLTVVFGSDEPMDEETAAEHFLDWLGSSSDSRITEGLAIDITAT
jgi:hypothetical protein